MSKTYKVLFIFLIFMISLSLVSCDDSDPFKDRQDKEYYNTDIDIEMYQKAGYFNELGFYYGDYVIKSQVYLAPYYSVILPSPSKNDLAEGKVYHIYDTLYEFSLFNEILEKKDLVFGFSLSNYINLDNIVNCIGVKDKFLDSECIYDFLLLVDKDSNIYYVECPVDNIFQASYLSVKRVFLLEELNGYLIESKYVTDENAISVPYEDFEKAVTSLNEATFESWSDFVDTEFCQTILDKACFFTSGVLYNVFKIGNNFMLSVYGDYVYDHMVVSLTYYEEGVAMYTVKDARKFAEFVKGEIYHKYFGTYYFGDHDYVEIGMGANGPYFYCEVTTIEGFTKEYSGSFEIVDKYLIVEYNIKKYLYFKIIEEENKITLMFDNEKSDLN